MSPRPLRSGSVAEPGGTVTFTVEVTNTAPEGVTLTVLNDDVFGDLLDGSNPAITNNTCDDQPTAIGIGGTFTCTFDAALSRSGRRTRPRQHGHGHRRRR